MQHCALDTVLDEDKEVTPILSSSHSLNTLFGHQSQENHQKSVNDKSNIFRRSQVELTLMEIEHGYTGQHENPPPPPPDKENPFVHGFVVFLSKLLSLWLHVA